MNKQIEIIEQFPESIQTLKRTLSILVACDSQEAACAITMKMVEVLQLIVDNKPSDALSCVWQCSFVIVRVLYRAVSEQLKKESKRAVAAECAVDDGNYKLAYEEYLKACKEISVDTGLGVLFQNA